MNAKLPQLPRWQMILYASGSLAVALSYQSFGTYIQFLYIDILGLPAAWVGISWSIYGLWNAINDPLAGYWSDATRTRWGRRIPWIAGLFIPLSLTFYMLWTPPEALIGDNRSLILYFLAAILIFDLLWTIVVMNWTALFPEMIPDEKQRANVSAWRQTFSLVGLIIGVALPPILAGEDWSGRGGMALLLAGVTAFFFGLSLFGSRERPEFWQDTSLPFKDALRTSLANRDFRYFLAANLMVQFVFGALTASVPFYTKYVLLIQSDLTLPGLGLTLDVGLQNSLFLGLAFIIALPALPVWAALARRVGAWRALRVSCLLGAGILLLFFWPRDFYGGTAVALLFGLNLAGLLMLPDLLIADLVDADELDTGTRREGMYFGMNGLIIRLAFSLQGIITGTVLTWSGYVAPTPLELYPAQPDAALWGIRLMIGGFPALALLLAYWFLRHYALHGQRLTQVQTDVAQMQARKRSDIG